ncbi:MAG: DJ-1/PfpI family protein [Gammaproteobacteria bacterium]|nr:MAG: DJ-1/PfpI family protein [Gammaproteobacteria bacterium]
MQKKLGILVFDEVEVLDFSGPFEVFSVARLNEESRRSEPSPFDVMLVAQFDRPVIATGGLKVLPDATFKDCPPLDVLLVPGGLGTRWEMHNEKLLSFVRARAGEVELLASICTGALILGSAGLLDGRTATTHWHSLQLLGELFPSIDVDCQARVVRDGNIMTSAGISAGIDMSLDILAGYFGDEVARFTASYMEYPYPGEDVPRQPQPGD